jgi:hypothetical protein
MRYLHWRSWECRDKDRAEMLCLLVEPIFNALQLEPMIEQEAWAFHRELKESINTQQKKAALTRGPERHYERSNRRIPQRPQ